MNFYNNTHSFTPANTIFGGAYVPEQHGDKTHWNLGPADKHDFVADLDALLKILRSALSLR